MHPVLEPFFGFLILAPVSVLGLLELVFQIWMLVDAIQNPRLQGSQRVLWALVIILMPCLGPLLYYLLGRSK